MSGTSLVANDPEGFSAAYAKLPTDVPLRLRLTDAGNELYVGRYGWDVIVPTVVDLALGVASGKTVGPSFSRRDPLGDDVAKGGESPRPTAPVRDAPLR
jgi:hypothetical protein